MCNACGYKSLPYIFWLMALLEFVLGITRVSVFFNPKSIITFNYLNVQLVNQSSVESIFLSSKQSIAAFIIDWIASIVPTFMGFYVALFTLLGICGILSCLGFLDDKNQGNRANCVEGCGYCCNICIICANKANHRCVSLTWNCPCYKTRPKLRFQLRFGIQLFIIFLRTIAIILYVTDKKTDIYGKYMGSICAISIGIVCLVMLLDYYQYRVWWHYKPSEAHEKCRWCCCTQTFHPSHQRFIPRPLLGRYRDPGDIGNEPCENTVAGYCSNLSLEHIVIYHAFDYIPQRRLQPDKDNTYIGFHCTDSSSAANIAKTGFLINPIASQMLGYGIYFARCFAQAERKARHHGAFICAKIYLGRVLYIERADVNQVSNSIAWWDNYDSVYCSYDQEEYDEFCVKDPTQILEWIIIVKDDDRIRRYGLDKEFQDTCWGCI